MKGVEWNRVQEEIEKYMLHFDMDMLKVASAVVLSPRIRDKFPLWVVLVAPSSGGKDTVLDIVNRACQWNEHTQSEFYDDWTDAGFEDFLENVDGKTALLRDFSMLVTQVNMDRALAKFRAAHSGTYVRQTGIQGRGGTIHSRCNILLNATYDYDEYAELHTLLGARFLVYRSRLLPRKSQYKALLHLLETGALEVDNQAIAQVLSQEFVKLKAEDLEKVTIPNEYHNIIADVVWGVCRLRVSKKLKEIWTEGKRKEIALSDVIWEAPYRLGGTVRKLIRIFAWMDGCKEATNEHVRLGMLCAVGTIPELRYRLIASFYRNNPKEPGWDMPEQNLSGIAKVAEMNVASVQYHLEQLETYQLTIRKEEGFGKVVLVDDVVEVVKMFDEKVPGIVPELPEAGKSLIPYLRQVMGVSEELSDWKVWSEVTDAVFDEAIRLRQEELIAKAMETKLVEGVLTYPQEIAPNYCFECGKSILPHETKYHQTAFCQECKRHIEPGEKHGKGECSPIPKEEKE